MNWIHTNRLRKLIAFVVYGAFLLVGLWITRNAPSAVGLYAAFAPAFSAGFTALMWGNHKEHEHDAKCSAQPPTQDQPQ